MRHHRCIFTMLFQSVPHGITLTLEQVVLSQEVYYRFEQTVYMVFNSKTMSMWRFQTFVGQDSVILPNNQPYMLLMTLTACRTNPNNSILYISLHLAEIDEIIHQQWLHCKYGSN